MTPSKTTALERAKRDDVSDAKAGDPEMEAAFAQARATLDDFIAMLAAPPPDTDLYALKIAVVDGKVTEYFWVVDVEYDGARFTGCINNTPSSVRTVELGEVVTFGRDDVYDWLYRDGDGRMVGNFTYRVFLARENPDEADEVRREVGLDRD